ncbi:MAG: DUF2520 domain-containing protein [Bacteroidaceae bacterium]|nr:DUF2520 domain-containing protein [Bacteroidaceae bacterium]
MEITLIGTGNVATSLRPALEGAGHEVRQLSGRKFSPSEVAGDVVIVSVRDDAIASVTDRLRDCTALVVHTAGSIPMEIIPSRRRGVLYPMQTFSRERRVDMAQVALFIESEPADPLLETLARSISQHVYQLDSEGRRHLHLAAVFASNFVNHCYTLSAEILEERDLPFDVMLPLVDEVARKVHTLPPLKAQTGPAARGDRGVMMRQEAMLSGRKREIYRLMSESIYDKLRLTED